MNKNLLNGEPWKGILAFMFPVFMGMLLQQFYNTADTIIVGNFASEEALAAVGACGVLTMAFLALANGFSAGACVLIAQLFGAGEQEKMRRQASTALLTLIGMGIVSSVVGVIISRFALNIVLATPEGLLDMADSYFKLYALGLVFQFGYNIIAAILRGIGDSKATLYFLLVSSIINIVLDILFIYNFHMGVAGAAIATDIAQMASCIAAFIYMVKKYPLFRWKLTEFTFEKTLAMLTLQKGFPMALQQLIVSVGFIFIQRAVNSYGEAMTASFSVAQKVETYLTLTANALMTTQSTYTAQNIGAKRMDRVITGARHTVIISEIISICICAVVFIFAEPIVTAFGLKTEAIGYCTAHVRCIAICVIPFASYYPILGLFQGANDALYSTFVATSALAIRAVSTYALQKIPAIGYNMIWWNAIFGWGLGFIITWVHFFKGKWKISNAK
ncbi:MAG: MATE family efflux transporter [Erysipelotrichaceae bacterium]|nr:MATE family efflux transporter [Erysipelotrichaceae bacterium]